MEQEKEQEAPKKRMGRWKKFFLVLLILAIIGAGVYFYRDKPCKLVQTTDFNADVNSAAGEIVDYHFVYNALQEEDVGDVEKNGWRLILQAFGPRFLTSSESASRVAWEDYPTNFNTSRLFSEYWVPLCQKFQLDPNERPTFFDRSDLWSFVEKNGLTGNEPEPEETELVFDDCDDDLGSLEVEQTKADSLDVYLALTSKPWTKEEFPFAAQWFDENADYMDVFARAARSPSCVCWRVLKDLPDGYFIGMNLADTQYTKEISRLLVARANYRLGSGDVSGAIDDVETITLFARAALESKAGTTVDRFFGILNLCLATGVQIFNSPVPPTDAELARVAALWRDFLDSDYFVHGLDLALDSEKFFALGSFQDILVLRRRGSIPSLMGIDAMCVPDGLVSLLAYKAAEWFFIFVPPVDDAKAFGKFRALCERMKDAPDEVNKELDKDPTVVSWLTSTPETNMALFGARVLFASLDVVRDAYPRADCVMREKSIVCALLAYQKEHGTLPPAFTVDADGNPLHSWRVLILPYLGEEEKALYDEIALDESWNSEHNREFFARVPNAYCCPMQAPGQAEGETIYSVLMGDDGFFDDSGVGKDLAAALEAKGDDAARQPILVERGDPVCWMKPDAELRLDDFATGQAEGVKRFFKGCRHSEGMNYATASGSTLFIGEPTAANELNALLRGLPAPPKETDLSEEFDEPTSDEASVEEAPAEPVE